MTYALNNLKTYLLTSYGSTRFKMYNYITGLQDIYVHTVFYIRFTEKESKKHNFCQMPGFKTCATWAGARGNFLIFTRWRIFVYKVRAEI